MGNTRNRKKPRIPPAKKAKKFKDGRISDTVIGPSAQKIAKSSAQMSVNSPNVNTKVKEGTVFMALSVLFSIFDDILKCPECGSDMDSQVDLLRKNGFSTHIVLQCKSSECEFQYIQEARPLL